MNLLKEKLRLAFEAGRKQQQMSGNNWYPSKQEREADFEAFYKTITHEKKKNC